LAPNSASERIWLRETISTGSGNKRAQEKATKQRNRVRNFHNPFLFGLVMKRAHLIGKRKPLDAMLYQRWKLEGN